ncbi:MAG: MarR family transcriptional regulator, partial [Pirellula sp.]
LAKSPVKEIRARCLPTAANFNIFFVRACTHERCATSGDFMTDKSELPIALRAAYLAMHRQSDAKFAEHGVTADQFVLLAALSRGNAVTQRQLAQRMPSDPSTVRAMLVLLEKKGLVQRDTHPSDSRARTVSLTLMESTLRLIGKR